MASDRNRRHILVNGEPSIERYTPHRQRITPAKPPAPQSRVAHGNALKQELKVAADEAKKRRHDGKELERLMEFAGLQDLQVSQRRLQFDDRIVVLVRATPAALSASIGVLNDLAEVQRAKETAAVFADMGPDEQTDWVKDLDARTTGPDDAAPAVCILDTGINRGHPLIERALAADDCHTCDPAWQVHDHQGHGTEMAGLALYGDLTPLLAGNHPVQHRNRRCGCGYLDTSGHGGGNIGGNSSYRLTCICSTNHRIFW